MPVARFEVPDGRIARFEVAEGTTPEQAQAQIVEMIQDQGIQQEQVSEPEEKGAVNAIASALSGIPGFEAAAEFAAGTNRTVADLIDFVGVGPLNAALSASGADFRIPGARQSLAQVGGEGGFMEPGLARDITRAAGEIVPAAAGGGAILRQAASRLPAFTAGEGVGAGLLRQAGQTTAAGDIGLGAVSAAGAEIGEDIDPEVGGLIGGIAAPVGVAATGQALKGLFNMGARGVQNLTRSLSGMSEEGASKLLAEAMVREGLSPEDVTRRIAELGPDAIPADVGNNFARLLRTASNKIPRI